VAVLAATVAVVAFGVPLGLAVGRIQRERAELRLASLAARLMDVGGDRLAPTITLPQVVAGDDATSVGIYGPSGQRISGAGPATSPMAAQASARGEQVSGFEGDELAVASPLVAGTRGRDTVRVAEPAQATDDDVYAAWGLMALLAVAVVALAGAVGYVLARRVTGPLDRLTDNAAKLGAGDFGIRALPSGLAEVDAAADALERTAGRLGRLLERERAFSADASHQLRTPVTALRIGLESAALDPKATVVGVTDEALTQVDRLEATLEELIRLARDVDPVGSAVDVAGLIAEVQARWSRRMTREARTLSVDVPGDLAAVKATRVAAAHALDVLISNALEHGAGQINIRARAIVGGVCIDVSDEGRGVDSDGDVIFQRRGPAASGNGIGLALARSLVEVDGGSLTLAHAGPGPVFSIVLPEATAGEGNR
jgi:signal transduction histidine kinase